MKFASIAILLLPLLGHVHGQFENFSPCCFTLEGPNYPSWFESPVVPPLSCESDPCETLEGPGACPASFCLNFDHYCTFAYTDVSLIQKIVEAFGAGGFPDIQAGVKYWQTCEDDPTKCCEYDAAPVFFGIAVPPSNVVDVDSSTYQSWCENDADDFGEALEDLTMNSNPTFLQTVTSGPPDSGGPDRKLEEGPDRNLESSRHDTIFQKFQKYRAMGGLKKKPQGQHGRQLQSVPITEGKVCPLGLDGPGPGPGAPDDCNQNGMCGGDPHFQTWSGEFYDYNAECDLVFLQAPEFGNGLGLDIHIRTKARFEFSYIESAALRIGDDVLEVSSFGEYKLNGVMEAAMPAMMADIYPITYERINKKRHSFDIHLGGKENIVITTNKDMVSVKMGNATVASFGESSGLMGDFKNGKKLSRDGKTIIEDVNQFGQEWQVLETEAKLFDSLRAPQHPQQGCIAPDAKAASRRRRRRLGETISEEAAKLACAHWTDDHKDLCVYDVIAMGDLELAEAGAY